MKRNKVDKTKRGMQLAAHRSHTSTVVHAYSTRGQRHTRLPDASFLGLSVKPYIHTADVKKEGEKQRKIIQSDSMQKATVWLSTP